ncbi:MAG: hypothetical protein ACXADW_23620 [Candidatus Hodarchaeales archaeon]|jgi:hypothetical protein
MAKTIVHFLQKNRSIADKKIQASISHMEFKEGYYIVNPEAINRISKNGVLTKGSEMFFFEGNPSPIPIKKPDAKEADSSSKYLDNMIYVNFLEQTGDPRSEKFKSTIDSIKSLSNFQTLFRVIFVVLIVGTIARSWLMQLVSGW